MNEMNGMAKPGVDIGFNGIEERPFEWGESVKNQPYTPNREESADSKVFSDSVCVLSDSITIRQ